MTERDHDGQMSLGDHLEDLRRRIFLSMIGVVVMAVLTLSFGRSLIAWLCVPLVQVQRELGQTPQVNVFSAHSGFTAYLKVSIIAALILASPWVVYQLWLFVAPGLHSSERRVAVILAPFSAAMTALGVAFAYYVMLPVSLMFLLDFTESYPPPTAEQPNVVFRVLVDGMRAFTGSSRPSQPQQPPNEDAPSDPPESAASPDDAIEAIEANLPLAPTLKADPSDPPIGSFWIKSPENELRIQLQNGVRSIPLIGSDSLLATRLGISEYLGLVGWVMLGITIAFQLPVIMLILGWSGLVAPSAVAKYRRYCVFACFCIGALFTPADPVSMVVLALPLWGLFELGIVLMKLSQRTPEDARP